MAAAARRPSLASPTNSTANLIEKERKQRARGLLRDYYGLSSSPSSASSSSVAILTPSQGDPMDIDLPTSFNPELYFNSISSTASLPELLKRENELLTEIRELDGERQSLVYNHHHELIEASDTIKKMKSRALALDSSLDSLKASFESISQLSASLASPVASTSKLPSTSILTPRNKQSLSITTNMVTPTKQSFRDASDSTPTASTSISSASAPQFDPLLHLPALLALPILLNFLLSSPSLSLPPSPVTTRPRAPSITVAPSSRALADQLWGLWEPSIRSWEEAEIAGVSEVGKSCRSVLSRAKRTSVVNGHGNGSAHSNGISKR